MYRALFVGVRLPLSPHKEEMRRRRKQALSNVHKNETCNHRVCACVSESTTCMARPVCPDGAAPTFGPPKVTRLRADPQAHRRARRYPSKAGWPSLPKAATSVASYAQPKDAALRSSLLAGQDGAQASASSDIGLHLRDLLRRHRPNRRRRC